MKSRRVEFLIEYWLLLSTGLTLIVMRPMADWIFQDRVPRSELVPPWEFVSPLGHLITIIAGLIVGGLILLALRVSGIRKRLLRIGSIVEMLVSLIWAYFLTGVIVDAPGYRCIFSIRMAVMSAALAIVCFGLTKWEFYKRYPKTNQPGTGDKQ